MQFVRQIGIRYINIDTLPTQLGHILIRVITTIRQHPLWSSFAVALHLLDRRHQPGLIAAVLRYSCRHDEGILTDRKLCCVPQYESSATLPQETAVAIGALASYHFRQGLQR